MGSKVDFFVLYSELASYLESVEQNRILGKTQQFCHFLIRLPLLDKVGNSNFHGGKTKKFRR